jgi:hypothetical protein
MRPVEDVVNALMPRLRAGEKVDVPAHVVEHPQSRPDLFAVPPGGAWDMGQTCDYVWRLEAGGRVHAQCFNRERRRVVRFHLDRYDPDRRLIDAALHFVLETPAGPALAFAGVAFLVAKIGRM